MFDYLSLCRSPMRNEDHLSSEIPRNEDHLSSEITFNLK